MFAVNFKDNVDCVNAPIHDMRLFLVQTNDCIGSCKSNYLPCNRGHDGKWDSYNIISIYVKQGTSTRPYMFFIGASNFTSPPVSNTNLTLNTYHTPFQDSLNTYHTPFLYILDPLNMFDDVFRRWHFSLNRYTGNVCSEF
jgi:hypothetical protein